MRWVKRLILTAVLVGGVATCGTALGADEPSPFRGQVHAERRSELKRVHDAGMRGNFVTWQVDVMIRGAKGRDCVVTVELCNAAGQPHVGWRDGKPLTREQTIQPDTDDYLAEDLSFALHINDFRFFYGLAAKDLTFRVVVRDEATGKVLARSAVVGTTGLGTKLPPAPPERTDNSLKTQSVWMRLLLN